MARGPSGVLDLAGPLRHAARRFATGVTVVAVNGVQGAAHALTANSFVTLSLRPPLVGIATGPDGRFRCLVEREKWFSVSILAASQHRYATHYADRNRSVTPPEARLATTEPPFAVPVVPGCLGYFVCAVESIRPVGDHDLIVGEVWACETSGDCEEPLVFFNGGFVR